MSGRSRTRQSRTGSPRSARVIFGGALGAAATAAVVATGSAAPAQADFEDLLDPILQPLFASLATFDPAAAVDLTNWTDAFFDSLGSFDLATTSTAEPAGALAAAANAVADPPPLPITMLEGTEPTVSATINNSGDAVPLLVDTGSAGLVVPYTELGDNYFAQLQNLFDLGLPSGFGSSGYSGGVDYFYLTYDHVPVDYTTLSTTPFATDGQVNVEVFSYNPSNFASLFTNDAFQKFLGANEVNGILGIGFNANGPETSPFIDYHGVLVDLPHRLLDIGDTNTSGWVSTLGAPISSSFESVNNGTQIAVTNNIDSGGVFGTIPSTLAPTGSVPEGTVISAFNAQHQLLYSYTVGQFNIGEVGGPAKYVLDDPTIVSGTSIDSGVIPFLTHEVYLDYDAGTNASGTLIGTTYFSP